MKSLLMALGAALVAEALTVFSTQVHAVRMDSPWQDDPYNVVLSVTVFAVPALAAVIALRLPRWRAPGGADRERQTRRAAAVMLGLAAATALTEWAAVTAGDRPWRGWTPVLITGLVLSSAAILAAGAVMLSGRLPRRAPGPWRDDWLGDAAALPVLRRVSGPGLMIWIRRHATAVFGGASLAAAVGVTGAMAVGEGWTDPLLVGWALVLQTSVWFGLCVLGNAVCGFIARAPRRAASRRAEAASVGAGLGMLAMTAFRDQIAGPVRTVAGLVALTLIAGAAGALIAAAAQVAWSAMRKRGSASGVGEPG